MDTARPEVTGKAYADGKVNGDRNGDGSDGDADNSHILKGARAIARYMKTPVRTVYPKLKRRAIPCRLVDGTYYSTTKAIDAYLGGGEAT